MRHGWHDTDEVKGRHLDWHLFRRFVASVRPYKAMALLAFALLPLIAIAKLVQPYLFKIAIDDYIVPGEIGGLWRIALLFLLALIGESLFIFIQSYLVQSVGQRIMADLRLAGFSRLLRLPVPFFDRHPSGRLVTRLTSDIENIGELFGAGVIAAMADILTLFMIVSIMLWMNPGLSLVAFAVLPPLAGMLLLFRRNMRGASRQVRARLAGLNAYVAERIAGVSEVQLSVQQERTLDEFEELQLDYKLSTFRVINWDATLYAVVETLSSLAIAAVLWRGGGDVLHNVATFGTLVAFIEYVQKFFAPLRDLSAKFSVIQASNASLERIYQLLDEPLEETGAALPAGNSGHIRLQGVTFAYQGEQPVLKDIDLDLPPGQSVALVGDTGSGKTTLTRLLLGFYRPQKGKILWDDVDQTSLDPATLRARIGWVSQEPFLFAGSLCTNLDPDHSLTEEQLVQLIEENGAGAVLKRLGGLHGEIKERGRNLSAGERQLLCLSRALVHDPQLLILDEATSRLDTETEETVRTSLARAGRQRSLLLVAHRLATAAQADTIVVMRHGRILERGNHEQLLAANGLYARLWRLQQMGMGDSESLTA